MAFYQNIKASPDETDSFFTEIQKNDLSGLFKRIENLQGLLSHNIDNMTNFIEEFTAYSTQKLENETEIPKST